MAPIEFAQLPTLLDGEGRRITYLRLSVTERCNFACSYCSPGGHARSGSELSRGEIAELVHAMAGLGIRRVRITGGEPTLRRDLLEIAQDVADTPGIEAVALTTNGARLARLAAPLRAAGVRKLSVSLDTLNRERLRSIAGPTASLDAIAEGLESASRCGFESLAVNVVVVRGENDAEVGDLVRHAWRLGATPRFIELMPFASGMAPVTACEVERLLSGQGIELTRDPDRGWGPARYMAGLDARNGQRGRVGFVASMSEPDCARCNRIRVGPDGLLRPCLGGRGSVALRPLLVPGRRDALERAVLGAIAQKPPRHHMVCGEVDRMVAIGG